MKLLKVPEAPWEEFYLPTTLGIIGTTQFIEAKNSGYTDFQPNDLYSRARIILQKQLFMVYRWSLIRFCVAHPIAEKYIPAKFFQIIPQNFIPDNIEIQNYINSPKFMWRFSMINYGYFAKLFGKHCPIYHHSTEFDNDDLLTHDLDYSPLVAYVKSNQELVSSVKYRFHLYKSKDIKGIEFSKITEIMEKLTFELADHEEAECFHSDDYYLHLMATKKTEDFTSILITGHYADNVLGNLLRESINEANHKLANMKKEKLLPKMIRDERKKKLSKKNKREKEMKKIMSHTSDDLYNCQVEEPGTASCYLGKSGNVTNTVRLFHLTSIVRKRSMYAFPECVYTFSSNWNEIVLFSDNGYQGKLYRSCIEVFGDKAKLQLFKSIDHYGGGRRIGWTMPCSSKESIEILSRYICKDLIRYPNNFYDIPCAKINNGVFVYCEKDDDKRVSGYATSCFTTMDRRNNEQQDSIHSSILEYDFNAPAVIVRETNNPTPKTSDDIANNIVNVDTELRLGLKPSQLGKRIQLDISNRIDGPIVTVKGKSVIHTHNFNYDANNSPFETTRGTSSKRSLKLFSNFLKGRYIVSSDNPWVEHEKSQSTDHNVDKSSVKLDKPSVKLDKPSVELDKPSVELDKSYVELGKSSVELDKPSDNSDHPPVTFKQILPDNFYQQSNNVDQPSDNSDHPPVTFKQILPDNFYKQSFNFNQKSSGSYYQSSKKSEEAYYLNHLEEDSSSLYSEENEELYSSIPLEKDTSSSSSPSNNDIDTGVNSEVFNTAADCQSDGSKPSTSEANNSYETSDIFNPTIPISEKISNYLKKRELKAPLSKYIPDENGKLVRRDKSDGNSHTPITNKEKKIELVEANKVDTVKSYLEVVESFVFLESESEHEINESIDLSLDLSLEPKPEPKALYPLKFSANYSLKRSSFKCTYPDNEVSKSKVDYETCFNKSMFCKPSLITSSKNPAHLKKRVHFDEEYQLEEYQMTALQKYRFNASLTRHPLYDDYDTAKEETENTKKSNMNNDKSNDEQNIKTSKNPDNIINDDNVENKVKEEVTFPSFYDQEIILKTAEDIVKYKSGIDSDLRNYLKSQNVIVGSEYI
ncbi:hypothetical protein C6P40_003339 [Pichia californica]|uniref:Uncharacterized protein n=1 Tax=Pichia californica TaxID=460514 RepID=A0A9P6WJA5_9ASCO|nr:hypothetical protein C6P40_003339 [[Candida] californica]